MGERRELPLTRDQDWAWIEKILEGDRSAFEVVFRKHQSAVINLAYKFLRDRHAAEDVAQTVFIKIYERKVRVDEKAKFTTWLYRVTVNGALDVARKRKFSAQSLDSEREGGEGEPTALLDRLSDPRAPSPAVLAARHELARLLDREIHRLSEKLRLPLLLYQFQELPYGEIAAILRISPKAVERRLYHAKEVLRKRLVGYY